MLILFELRRQLIIFYKPSKYGKIIYKSQYSKAFQQNQT